MSYIVDLKVDIISFPLHTPFRISRGVKTQADAVAVTINDEAGNEFMAECIPYGRYGETPDSVAGQIEKARKYLIGNRVTVEDVQPLLPPGAARNALDWAVWKYSRRMNSLPAPPAYIKSAQTIPIADGAKMVNMAQAAKSSVLKIKLGGPGDLELLKAVSKAAPDKEIIIDANEGWDIDTFSNSLAVLLGCNVRMVEQPLPADSDEALINFQSPVPIYADESVHTCKDLEALAPKYTGVNIKLDKTGGLTEALKLKEKALKLGFEVMVGCMVCSSLSIEPALYLVDDHLSWIDLDGAFWLEKDYRPPAINYDFWENDLGFPVAVAGTPSS